MADENKNQDPEEENKGASNDDDFGLPDFEFEALDDDDEDEVSNDSSETPETLVTDEEVPSIDDGDLEDLDLDLEGVDLEGIEDLDLDNLEDLGDLDIDDLDLEDLDSDLEDLDKVIEETDVPKAASAERVSDIFDDAPPTNVEDTIEDDGEFYEEESFEDFDGDFSEKAPEPQVEEELEAILEDSSEEDLIPGDLPSPEDEDGFDSSMFDDDTEGLDLGSGADEPVPFAHRDTPSEYRLDEEPEEEVSQEEINQSRSKFVKIVVLGTVLFVAIGFGFLYSSGKLDGVIDGEGKEVAENTPEKKEVKKPAAKKEIPAEDEGIEGGGAKTEAKTEKPATTKPKAEVTKPKPKPKQTSTKPATKPASSGVSTLGSATGQRHIIVGSFLDESSALAYAGKLAGQGVNASVIPPFKGAPNYRVSVASFANFAEANGSLERYREQYNGAWILKY